MVITSNSISLRVMEVSDWELFKSLNTDPEIMRHIYRPLSVEAAQNVFASRLANKDIESGEWLSFTIIDSSSHERIGFIGVRLEDIETKRGEVGFILDRSVHGKGYGTLALQLIKALAFETYDFHKLVATCSVNNVGSYKVLEKAGFVREGRLAHNSINNGNYVDDYVYGLLRSNQ